VDGSLAGIAAELDVTGFVERQEQFDVARVAEARIARSRLEVSGFPSPETLPGHVWLSKFAPNDQDNQDNQDGDDETGDDALLVHSITS
jgi:hypothetical protein